ncbi:helix-turn-helix domain-containing protein [Oligoflexus sp.]|uniref:helix-turn-helix domain-containing protein n=1 Tax=Oligoflexus sp. TaxID=1971216 RepID=UPI0039C8D038
MSTLTGILSEKIKAYLEATGGSLVKLAEEMGLPATTLRRWGKQDLSRVSTRD